MLLWSVVKELKTRPMPCMPYKYGSISLGPVNDELIDKVVFIKVILRVLRRKLLVCLIANRQNGLKYYNKAMASTQKNIKKAG